MTMPGFPQARPAPGTTGPQQVTLAFSRVALTEARKTEWPLPASFNRPAKAGSIREQSAFRSDL